MFKTKLCSLLGIECPILQGPFGPWPALDLAVAVSEAGGLGSLSATLHTPEQLQAEIKEMQTRTDRPFLVNHTRRPFSEELFALTLAARPPIISLGLGDPGDLPRRTHEVGSLFLQQVTTVEQAVRAAECGADIISAQGSEAGGFGGEISLFALLPQVVDAVSPIPVVASGGIADGRGLAAALMLGAQGINIGTRFLAATETAVAPSWKAAVLAARSQDAVKIQFAESIFPPRPPDGWPARPRVLRTPFVDEWHGRLAEVAEQGSRLRDEVMTAVLQGKGHEYVPFTGQTAGMIHDILPAAEIIQRIMTEAEAALRQNLLPRDEFALDNG